MAKNDAPSDPPPPGDPRSSSQPASAAIADAAGRLGQVQSLVRAFALLDAMSQAPEGLTLTEAARAVGLPRSTAHRLLTTMESLRYVRFAPGKNRWGVGVQAFSVGAAFADARDLSQIGRPIMRSIMMAADENVNICVLRHEEIYCLDQVRARGDRAAEPAVVRPGVRLPMYATASGKAWLAYSDRAMVEGLLSRTPLRPLTAHAASDPRVFLDDLSAARARGYAVDDQEYALGTRCVAATVFDEHGRPHAVLSMSGPAARFSRDRMAQLGAEIAAAADRMTRDIGGRRATA